MNQNLEQKRNDDAETTSSSKDPEMTTEETKQPNEKTDLDTATTSSSESTTAADSGASTDSQTETASDSVSAETEVVTKAEKTDDETKTSETEENTSSMTGFVVGAIVLALMMIGGVLYFVSGTNVTEQSVAMDESTNVSIESLLGLDEGEPTDPIVAVNGEVLERVAYNRLRQQVAGQAQQRGMNLSATNTIEQIDTQALETLINAEVIRQAAIASDSEVDDATVDARFDEIVAQVGGAEELASALEEMGQTEEALRQDVQDELLVQSFIDTELEGEDLTVTEEEITNLYNQAGGAEAGLPPLEDVRVEIEQQIQAGKQQEIINTIVESLRDEAEVEVLI